MIRDPNLSSWNPERTSWNHAKMMSLEGPGTFQLKQTIDDSGLFVVHTMEYTLPN